MTEGQRLAYEPRASRLSGWSWWRCAMLGTYPLLTLAALYVTWLVAWVSLGHMPRSSLDDPAQIGPWVDVSAVAFALLRLGMLPAFAVHIGLAVATIARTGRRTLAPLAAAAAAWIVAYVVLAVDPGRVLYWYMD